MATGRFWDIIRRGEEGELIEVDDYDMKLFVTAKKLIKKYDIKFSETELVPQDDAMVDRAFQAGLEYLLEVGVFNIDTNRVIKITEEEIREAMFNAVPEFFIGEGKERRLIKHRGLCSKEKPLIIGGVGQQIDEDLREKVYKAYIKEPILSCLEVLPIYKFEGADVKAGSPFEVQAVLEDIAIVRKAARDVGRPGFPVQGRGGVSAASDIAASREDIGYRSSDFSLAYFKPQLKTSYDSLNRVVNYMQHDHFITGVGCAYIGGWAGGVEGTVIAAIAEVLASLLVHNADMVQTAILESNYTGASTRKAIWGTNMVSCAINKHVKVPNCWGVYTTYAGPCTKMCLQETAAMTIGTTLAGCNVKGLCPNQGVTPNYCTPMESRFMGEVAMASTELTREDANRMVNHLVEQFEERIKEKNPPKGKIFSELYDLDKLTVKQEYLDLYHEVWKELEALGLKKQY